MSNPAWERWLAYRDKYSHWLREIPMLARLGTVGESPEIVGPSNTPVYLDADFWSLRTHEVESAALKCLDDSEIDAVFDTVASVIDEDLTRFDPLVMYYGLYLSDGDPDRIAIERESAHNIKRDFAWAAIEAVAGQQLFFSSLLEWYSRGRWPCGWAGSYPSGHIVVL